VASERHQVRQRILGHSGVHDEAHALPADRDRSASDEVLDDDDQALCAGVCERGRSRLVVLHRVLSIPTVEVVRQRVTCPPPSASAAATPPRSLTTPRRRSPDDGVPLP